MHSCRLVCKLWKDEVTRTEKKRHRVKVNSEKMAQAVLATLDHLPSHQISSLYVDEFILDNPFLLDLVRRLGPTLSTLRIEDCKLSSIEVLHGMIRSFPNLIKLVVGTVKTPDNLSYYRVFPVYGSDGSTKLTFPNILHLDYISYNTPAPSTYLSRVINSFPNLVTLTAKNVAKESPDKFKGLSLPALRKLTVQMVPGDGLKTNHIECLKNLNLKLKELRLEVLDDELDRDVLRSFIESQASTLKELSLEQLNMEREPEEVSICPFPLNLPHLRDLTVGKTFIRNLVHVLNSFPQLEETVFSFVKGDNWAGILPKKVPEQRNILSTTIPWIDTKSFEKLARAFTNLTSLKIHEVTDEILQVIFKESPQLRILICFDGEEAKITDFGFTGISMEAILESIAQGGPNPFLLKPLELQKFIRDQRKQAYIGNLKGKRGLLNYRIYIFFG